MKTKLLLSILALSLFTLSCKKNLGEDPIVNQDINSLVVPSSFNWTTARDVNFTVTTHDSRFQNAIHVIEVYIGDPANGGASIAKGSVSMINSFKFRAEIPATVNEVYLTKTAPDGSKLTQKVALTSTSISLSIGSEQITQTVANIKMPNSKTLSATGMITAAATIADCSDCNTTITESKTGIDLNSGTLCITGSNITVGFQNVNGGTVRVCGQNVNLTGLKLGSNVNLIISNGGSVVNGSNITPEGGSLTNFGTITFANYTVKGTFINNGTFTVANTFTIDGTLENNGTLIAKSNLTVNGSGRLNNNCKLTVNSNFVNTGITTNNSYIRVDGTSGVGGTMNLGGGAMFETNDLNHVDGDVIGTGTTYALFKVTGTSDNKVNNGAKKFQKKVQYCDPKRDLGNGKFSDGASQSCDLYIKTDECNPVGNGSTLDRDDDGVNDISDDYPDDKTKAYNTLSVNYVNGGSTIAFEDSWPLKGDYDLNDVVLTYKYVLVTNAANRLVQVKGDYTLIASGGDFKNGAGIQFNLPAKSISGFTATNGATLESGQDSVVVILFDNSRGEQETWNTEPGKSVSPAKTYSFSFNLGEGHTVASFGNGTYNPFIWNNGTGYGRGYETHLIGKKPTKLANSTLFGTSDDNSKAGKLYSTKTNMPWALTIPTAPFNYPIERAAITETYLKFANWAISGGSSSIEWYNNTDAGYRNTDNIYIVK